MGYAPGMAEFVGRADEVMPADFHTLPLAEQRRRYASLTEVFPIEPPTDVSWTDVTIRHGDHAVPARVYRPHRLRSRAVLPYLRGGGFVLGSLDTHHSLVAELAAATGCRAVAVDYRAAPEHPFPAAVRDCYHALCGLASSPEVLGLDAAPDAVVVCGESSGANLAVAACLMARDLGGPVPRGQALISPVLDFTRWRHGGEDAPLLSGGEMELYTRCYCPDPEQAKDPYVSPLLGADFHGLPPAYVAGAELDSLLPDAAAYVERLRENDIPVEYVVTPGVVHAPVRARRASLAVGRMWDRFCAAVGRLAQA
ncbi:alpha/beta hydrolase [Solihabitans fulvus]|uniref:Alpha/beta hydrolase n=1 Tax=Solihabitans fulvus TaxID=1892852 RepID=A0A5B2WKD0_9PSEU|nr:alpha/beta hydrolase [Solihabitans fulvus]KAA2252533.1 alpha/beta hydrolase [Solihabitans fulvus]